MQKPNSDSVRLRPQQNPVETPIPDKMEEVRV